jgi:hypothetical protein
MSDPLKEINGKPVPQSTIEKIIELRTLEITLGHLPPQEWNMQELTRRMNDPEFPEHASQMERKTESLFAEIAHNLRAINFSAGETAAIINSHLRYQGGPKYCNEAEVQEALEQ